MKYFFQIVLILVVATSVAQQDAQYTQYMYNTINFNPAYAGSRGALSIFGLHRSQWVGLDGAPTTNTFSIHSPIRNSNLGFGLSFINDKIGPTSENQISADISYSLNISNEWLMSFGIKGTANLFNLDVSKLNPETPLDPSLQDLNNYFTPNLGAGIYVHSDKAYFGFSIPNFFETTRYADQTQSVSKQRMNYYIMGGYVFDINPNLKFKPAFLSKIAEGAPLQFDLSGNFLFYEKFVLGGAWRWNAAWSAMAGYQITDGLFIGYAFDQETTNLARFNSGSHEVFLRFELFQKAERIISPRFF